MSKSKSKKKKKKMLFWEYYEEWISLYKEGSIREVTLRKYKMTLRWLKILVPKLKLKKLDRAKYQKLINKYAETHERQTTLDFHRQVKSAIIDAIEDGYLQIDPTRKVIIKGKRPGKKKAKYLNLEELYKLIQDLNLGSNINYDWLIYLISKTGLRFSEALALTPNDFDFYKETLSVNKSWNYKSGGYFDLTKTDSSIRTISIDSKLSLQFKELCKDLPLDKPIFIGESGNVFNSTVNDILERHCENAKITNISLHGLRHTHASVLLYQGVSVSSVSKRLGHSSMATTQRVYLHIIQELENKDKNIMLNYLSEI